MMREKRLIDANELKDSFGFLRKMWSATEICGIIDAMPTADEWISVSERLPTEEDANINGSVLAINIHDGFSSCWAWESVKTFPESFTHWMPSPEPPKECG